MADKTTTGDPSLDALLASLGVVPTQGTHTISAPNDPDIINYLTQAGIAFTNAGGGRISFQVTFKGAPADTGTTGTTGGISGFGGGGGGSSATSDYVWLAKRYGWNLTGAQIAALQKNEVSPTEWQQRLESLQFVNDNQFAFDQFKGELQARGLLGKNADLSIQDRLNIVTRTAPYAWLNLWETTAARSAAVTAGFEIGGEGDTGVSRGQLLKLEKKIPGRQEYTDLLPGLQQAAQLALQLGSFSRWKDYGLRKRELLDVGAGVASAETSAKIQRMVQEQDAFAQIRGHIAFNPGNTLLAGSA